MPWTLDEDGPERQVTINIEAPSHSRIAYLLIKQCGGKPPLRSRVWNAFIWICLDLFIAVMGGGLLYITLVIIRQL